MKKQLTINEIIRQVSQDRSVPKCGKAKSDRVALGLAILECKDSAINRHKRRLRHGNKPGWSFQDLGFVCGCTGNALHLETKKALEKVKKKLMEDQSATEILELLFASDRERRHGVPRRMQEH